MINFSQKQLDFLRAELKDYNILQGTTASGKTFVVNLKWYQLICSAKKDSLFLQSGNTSETLFDNVTAQLLKLDKGINWLEYRAVEGRKRIVVRTGTQVVCIGANDELAKDRVQGKNIDGWYGDEITKQPKSFVEMADSRCRMEIDGRLIQSPIIFTLNPDSPKHFIKEQYIDNAKNINARNWYFDFKDNPIITQEYLNKLKGRYSGLFFQRMIEGKWAIAEGIIFNEFSRSLHCKKEFDINRIISYYIGIDWGYDNPMALVLMGLTGDNQYYCLDEISIREQLVDNKLKEIIENKGWFDLKIKISSAYGDPSRPDLISVFEKLTGIQTLPANNDVIEGIQEIQSYLKMRKNGECGIYFNEFNCNNLIGQIEGYIWKKNKTGVSNDEPVKVDEHSIDAIRYVVYSRKVDENKKLQMPVNNYDNDVYNPISFLRQQRYAKFNEVIKANGRIN